MFSDVTILYNAAYWVFDDMDNRKAVALVSVEKGWRDNPRIRLRGPYSSREAYERAMLQAPTEFPAQDFSTWSEGASFPLIPGDDAAEVFRRMRSFPRLDVGGEWDCQPVTEFHATADKPLMELDPTATSALWPVFKGASFDLWQSDRGADTYYAWADPDLIVPVLQERRLRSSRRSASPYAKMNREVLEDYSTLPCMGPRIAFRDVTNRTNQRTMIAALVPPRVALGNQAPYLVWTKGDERDQAYLLGVLCSMPFDWFCRRVIEGHMNFHLFNALPVPRPARNDLVRRRIEVIAGRLAATSGDYSDWAKAVGVPFGPVSQEEASALLPELDACVATLYGLSAADLAVVFGTFHEGADYGERLAAVLRHRQAET